MSMGIHGSYGLENYGLNSNYAEQAAKQTEGAKDAKDAEPKAAKREPEKREEVCVGNTDKVDQEIRKLRERKQQIEQQLRSASGDEKKQKELEKRLVQVTAELSQKDTDTYKRQHTSFSAFA